MSPNNPIISVCIPAYNCEQFIERTVKSVLNQVFEDYELIIVDDNSTDTTWDLLNLVRDPRVRLYRNDNNLGFAGNWNRAVELARGEYVKLLCHDDVIYPTCLEKQAAVLQHPGFASVQLIASARDVIGPGDNTILAGRCRLRPGASKGQDAIRATVRAGTNVIGEPSVTMFRRDVLAKVGPFSGANRYMIDLDMWCRMLLHGDLYMIDEVLSAFRIQTASMSWADRATQARQYRRFVADLDNSPFVSLSTLDMRISSVMSELNALGRQMFYRIYLSRAKSNNDYACANSDEKQ